MVANEPTPGPSNVKRSRKSVKLTEKQLLSVLDNSDFLYSEDEAYHGDCHLEAAEELQSDDSEKAQLSNLFHDSSESDDTDHNDCVEIDDEKEPDLSHRDNPGELWHKEPHNMQYHPFTKEEVLQIHPAGNSPMDFFGLLVTDELLQLVVDETNNNAVNSLLSENRKEGSRICKWKPLSIGGLLVFLGVLLHMGNVKYLEERTAV
ncbi:uncharacterized protein LOC126154242 [Schistocerca cancellata]|uniref:uncharacterized protein LOC126154242 n=1 Tax=Schistocerca cancellata TaxID=274614 RepID=UPI002118211F|nr:uncharacterized protein LOC126154242 [Schistocerca cancellata]